jgi:glycosyltransferase involved in cell wall biosynthesis
MKILILSQYYPPETGAAQNRLRDWAEYLAQVGHRVTVLTGFPNYPKGEVFEGYRGHIFLDEQEGNIRILRSCAVVTRRRSFFLRLANYFSFLFTSFIAGLVKAGKQDLVLVELPPLFLGLSAIWLRRLKGASLAINVSDLWPRSAIALGVLRNQTLIRWATLLEEHLYRQADIITGQTSGIVSDIGRRFPAKTVTWVPNGVGGLGLRPPEPSSSDRNLIRQEFQVMDKCAVVYAGLHGIAQRLETMLEAADILKDQSEIRFVLIGDGPEKQFLQKRVEELRLTNVRFYPPTPSFRMSQILSALDIAIVPLKKHDLFRGALPSKLFEAMGAALPIVLSIRGEAQELVETSQCGICVEPEDPREMATAILKLARNPELRSHLGRNGREYVEQHYNRVLIAGRLEKLLLFNRRNQCESGLQTERLHES